MVLIGEFEGCIVESNWCVMKLIDSFGNLVVVLNSIVVCVMIVNFSEFVGLYGVMFVFDFDFVVWLVVVVGVLEWVVVSLFDVFVCFVLIVVVKVFCVNVI